MGAVGSEEPHLLNAMKETQFRFDATRRGQQQAWSAVKWVNRGYARKLDLSRLHKSSWNTELPCIVW